MERDFTLMKTNSNGYDNLYALCSVLNTLSPNGFDYEVKRVYRDFGAKIVWDTIVYNGKFGTAQALTPSMWDRTTKSVSPVEILKVAEEYFSNPYCEDV